MNRHDCLSVLMISLALAAVAACCSFSTAAPTPGGSLEETLFDEARPGPLPRVDLRDVDPLHRAAPSPFPPERLTRRSVWARELGQAGFAEGVLPLLSVAEQMRDVQGLLGRAECGATTQHSQREILESLEQILRGLECSCRGAKPGDGEKAGKKQESSSASQCNKQGDAQKPCNKQGTKPDNTGKATVGSGEKPDDAARRVDPRQMRALMKELWGELPPRQREQMLQMPVEEFLPRYELLIEEYFRRLSEEKKRQPASPVPSPILNH